jgi:DNA-binding MarR family transcriptional regulator
MIGASTPEALAARFAGVAHMWVADGPRERAERGRRELPVALATQQPATVNQVAHAVHRGAPAVSRSVEALVRAGLVERTQDPKNRRRLELRVTEEGRERLGKPSAGSSNLLAKLERLAHSELRAVERAIEILERGF